MQAEWNKTEIGALYDVYLGGDSVGKAKSRWIKVGIAFPNQDGSIHVVLDAFPVNGKLLLRLRNGRRRHLSPLAA